MKRILLMLSIFGLSVQVYATPVSVLYFASKWIEAIEVDFDEDDVYAFQLGILFPNISYLNVPLRFEPQEPVQVDEIKSAETPFERGRLLYYFVRDMRKNVIDRINLCPRFENIPEEGREMLVELLEDHYYYEEVDRETLQSKLDDVLDDEEDAGVPYHQLRSWHRLLNQYLFMDAFRNLLKLKKFNIGGLGISKETIADWAREFPSLVESADFQSYVAELEADFAKALQIPIASVNKQNR